MYFIAMCVVVQNFVNIRNKLYQSINARFNCRAVPLCDTSRSANGLYVHF